MPIIFKVTEKLWIKSVSTLLLHGIKFYGRYFILSIITNKDLAGGSLWVSELQGDPVSRKINKPINQ